MSIRGLINHLIDHEEALNLKLHGTRSEREEQLLRHYMNTPVITLNWWTTIWHKDQHDNRKIKQDHTHGR